MKQLHKESSLILAAVLIFLLLPVFSSQSSADGNIDIKLDAGFDGKVKRVNWVPVRAGISNNGSDLEAVLQVKLKQSNVAYERPIYIPGGSTKTVDMVIPEFQGRDYITARVIKKGNVLSSQTLLLNSFEFDDIVVGVLSESDDPLRSLSINSIGINRYPYVLNFDDKSFPSNTGVLRNLNVLLIDNYPTEQLTDKQINALNSWVEEGGLLVIAGGPNWHKTVKNLPSNLIPVKIRGIKTITQIEAFEEYTDYKLVSEIPFAVSDTEPKPLSFVQLEQSNIPIITTQKIGRGTTVYSAVDLASEPFSSWKGARSFWINLLEENNLTGDRRVKEEFYYEERRVNLNYVLSNMAAFNIPSPFILALLAAVYIVIIGPLNYYVLKRMDKREWMWVTVPVLVLVLTTGIYLFGLKGKGSDTVTSCVTLVELSNQYNTARLHQNIGIFGPRMKKYNIELEGDVLVKSLMRSRFPRKTVVEESEEAPVYVTITLGENTLINLEELVFWEMRDFYLERTVQDFGSLNHKLYIENNNIKGEITNNTGIDLSDALILSREGFARIGDLPAGDSLNINQELSNDEKFPLVNQIYREHFPRRGQDISEEERLDIQKRNILVQILGYEGQFIDTDFVFIGWNRNKLVDLKINGRSPRIQTLNVVKLPLRISPQYYSQWRVDND